MAIFLSVGLHRVMLLFPLLGYVKLLYDGNNTYLFASVRLKSSSEPQKLNACGQANTLTLW